MTFLPIVERELRVAARRRHTYSTRLVVAAGAILIGVILYLSSVVDPVLDFGHTVFWSLAWLCIIHCVFAGRRSTADSLSVEKREGTLGLLFLTDLKGYDVVAGKLVASSLNGFYGLLAVFPVLAVPLLIGGMTNGEFWRMVLVLISTFLFSLAIGIFVSALSRDARTAMAGNLLLMLGLAGVVPVCASMAMFLFSRQPVPELFFSCPFYPFYLSSEIHYRAEARHFWYSLAEIQGFTWLFIILACCIAPRSWQEHTAKKRSLGTRWREFWRAWSYGNPAKSGPFRKCLLDVNAFYWLAARARLKPLHVWMFVAVAVPGWWLGGWYFAGSLWLDDTNPMVTAFILNIALKLWLAGEAGQQLSQDRNTGALELILSTPMTVRDIVHGQFLALRRQFLKPVLAVMAIELMLMTFSLTFRSAPRIILIYLAGITILAADMIALSWVAMSAALTAKNASRATLQAVVSILVLPLILFGLIVAIATLWAFLGAVNGTEPGWTFFVGWWFGLSLVADVVFSLRARWRLQEGFRRYAAEGLSAKPIPLPGWFSWRKHATGIDEIRKQKAEQTSLKPVQSPKQRRWKRWAIGALGIVLVTACVLYEWPRPPVPPPVMVTLSQSNGPVRVFPSEGRFFFILPDGSLWRWGQAGGAVAHRVSVPEQVGTNYDWAEVSACMDRCVGLKNNGTIWDWGTREKGQVIIEPRQIDPGSDWIAVAAGAAHGAALKKDGSLWTWGPNNQNQLGNGPGPNEFKPVQVGTNLDWKAVRCNWCSTFAVRADGTLWAWGQVWSWSPAGVAMGGWTLRFPTQVCEDTNWVGFVPSSQIWARTQTGTVWEPLHGNPGPQASVAMTCRRIASNPASDHPAFAVRLGANPVAQRYEVRSNGTLWATECAPDFEPTTTAESWRRVGKRSDWVSVWGAGTVVGLTSDGTLWMWGSDLGQEEIADFHSRLDTLRGAVTGRRTGSSGQTFPPYQDEPRPLLRIVPGATTAH